MNRNIILSACMLMFASHYAGAQRTVSGFSEVRITEGDSKLIDGQERTEPDIYYVDKGDGTYQAIRLTVAPAGRAEMTVPYIYMNTSHSICVNWKSMTDGAGHHGKTFLELGCDRPS